MPSSETCGGRTQPYSPSVPRSARRSAPAAPAVFGRGRCSFSSPADLSRPGCRSFCADHPDGRAIAELSCRRPAEEGCCSRSRRGRGTGVARCDRTQRRPRPPALLLVSEAQRAPSEDHRRATAVRHSDRARRPSRIAVMPRHPERARQPAPRDRSRGGARRGRHGRGRARRGADWGRCGRQQC